MTAAARTKREAGTHTRLKRWFGSLQCHGPLILYFPVSGCLSLEPAQVTIRQTENLGIYYNALEPQGEIC